MILNVDRNDAITAVRLASRKSLHVNLERFLREQVDGDGVAAERVEDEQVTMRRRFVVQLALDRQPCVAEFRVNVATALLAILQKRKPFPASGNVDDGRIDFVKANGI